jgi:hypothetical protein
MLTDEQKSLVDECIYLRGRIVTSYSQVEFILADISVILDLKFPYLISKRIKAAKEIADRPGYETYKDELHSVCDGLGEFDEMRVFMAHGWVSAELGKSGTNIIEFLRYERTGEGSFNSCVGVQISIGYAKQPMTSRNTQKGRCACSVRSTLRKAWSTAIRSGTATDC